MNFKRLLSFLSILFLSITFCKADVCFKSVDIRYYKEQDFQRISEFFTGKEDTGKNCILRTCDSCREGLYFIINFQLPPDGTCLNGKLTLSYTTNCNPKVQTITKDIVYNSKFNTFVYFGITDPEFVQCKDSVSSWKLEFNDHCTHSVRQSYLWHEPSAK